MPEGLPLAVTLALAFSVRRMLADHNLVRCLLCSLHFFLLHWVLSLPQFACCAGCSMYMALAGAALPLFYVCCTRLRSIDHLAHAKNC